MSAPTLACVGVYAAMGDIRFTLVGILLLVVLVIPVTILFTVAPMLAFLKKDELRDVDVDSVISDEPANTSGLETRGAEF